MSRFFDPVVKMIIGLAAQQIRNANDKNGQKMVSVGKDHQSRHPRRALTVVCWRIEDLAGRRVREIKVPAQEVGKLVSIPTVCNRCVYASGTVRIHLICDKTC